MGIERARVVEVHASGRVGAGYLIGERLVLTAGGLAGGDVRPAGTATWYPASPVWTAKSVGAALLEADESLAAPTAIRWGEVTGRRPVAVTAMGFPPAQGRSVQFRDAEQFVGQVVAAGDGLGVEPAPASRLHGEGLHGAALFAGAELVGVVAASGLRAVPVSAFASDPRFVAWAGAGNPLALTPVRAGSGFSIL